MPMKILDITQTGSTLCVRVHLDTERTVERDGETLPDPAWVREYPWGVDPPTEPFNEKNPAHKGREVTKVPGTDPPQVTVPAMTPEQYVQSVIRESQLLAVDELARLTPQPAPGFAKFVGQEF